MCVPPLRYQRGLEVGPGSIVHDALGLTLASPAGAISNAGGQRLLVTKTELAESDQINQAPKYIIDTPSPKKGPVP